MNSFMKITAIVISSLISFSSYAWDVTDARKNKEFNEYITKKIVEVKDYIKFQKTFEKYFDEDKQIEDNDFEPLAKYTEFMAFVVEKKCAEDQAKNFIDTSRNLGGRIPLLNVLIDFTDRNLEQCQKWRASLYELSKNIQNKTIQTNYHSKYFEILEIYGKAGKVLLAEFKSNMDDVTSGRPPRFTKISKYRALAKDDVVAQLLNYASGVPEDASGMSFYYPESTDNGQCVYKVGMDKGNPMASATQGLVDASNFIASVTGSQSLGDLNSAIRDGIDLNKADLKNITFYQLKGAKQNKLTGVTAYLRYQSRVEGLPDIFECDSNSCNIDRLKRGWSLVASKCKGVTKAF